MYQKIDKFYIYVKIYYAKRGNMDMLTDNFDKTRRNYHVDIYNRYVDIAFAHADLDEFDIDEADDSLIFESSIAVLDYSAIKSGTWVVS